MTAAYRLKGLGWFGGVVLVALGFYLVSLQVANERKKLDMLNGRIRLAERDIRALETEFDTRANLVQLEKWNGDTLALTAPVAGQFVSSEAALASIDFDAIPAPGGAGGVKIQTAQLLVPSLPSMPSVGPTTPAPTIERAAVQMAAIAPPKPQAVRAAVRSAKAEAVIVRTAAVAKVRPQAVAMLDRKLLSDTTLGDILSNARAEARRR